jgi:chaperonin GroEL
LEGDQKVGLQIVKRAIEEPIRQIVANCGLEGAVIVQEVKAKSGNFGFDARNEKYVDDMIAEGIIDPTKVTRTAIENAASVAGLLLTTEAMVADEPEEEKAPAMPGGMDGMGGMGGMM